MAGSCFPEDRLRKEEICHRGRVRVNARFSGCMVESVFCLNSIVQEKARLSNSKWPRDGEGAKCQNY